MRILSELKFKLIILCSSQIYNSIHKQAKEIKNTLDVIEFIDHEVWQKNRSGFMKM